MGEHVAPKMLTELYARAFKLMQNRFLIIPCIQLSIAVHATFKITRKHPSKLINFVHYIIISKIIKLNPPLKGLKVAPESNKSKSKEWLFFLTSSLDTH